MKHPLKLLSIALVFAFVSVASAKFFLPRENLLADYSFSQAVYSQGKQDLLRLTLSKDEQYRLYTPLTSIDRNLISSTLLQEDQYFRWHFGINPFALVKATWQTYVLKSRRFGASTITMQLVRLKYGENTRSITGKLKQMGRAIVIESLYSKDEILEAYLNLAPYGNNIQGVGAASLIYFNKPVNQLTVTQALTLAVIPQHPAGRTPKQHELQSARNKLFMRWIKIHPEDAKLKSVIELPLQMQSVHTLAYTAPHFVNATIQHASSDEIVTTLDLSLQTLFQRTLQRYLKQKKSLKVNNAAIMLVDTRDMHIKAALGSADFFNNKISGQINGMEIKRSPGSTLKPFIYALAFDQGLIHPNTMLKDVPRSFGSYNPENFDYDFMGSLSAKDALILSRNIPAIHLLQQLTNPSLYQLLQAARIKNLKSEHYYGLGIALGGVELTMEELVSLYAMLKNEGIWQPLQHIESQTSYFSARLLSKEASFLVLDALEQTQTKEMKFTNHLAMAFKTGTSSGYRDAWTVGVVDHYVLAVWIGNFDNSSNPAFVGKSIAAPFFFMLSKALATQRIINTKPITHPERLNLRKIKVCKESGLLPNKFCPNTVDAWFIPGKSPIKTDTIHREIAINSITGLRTCHFDENTQFKVYEFWPSDLLAVYKQAGMQRQLPPAYEANCSIRQEGLAPQITSPKLHLSYVVRAAALDNTFVPLSATVDADVTTLYWFVNESFIGKASRGQPFIWKAKSGKQMIRVVDDQGRSDVREIKVSVEA